MFDNDPTNHARRCPLCGAAQKVSKPLHRTTPWTDTCACSDYGPCVAHTSDWEDAPVRPSDEVIYERSKYVQERQQKLLEARIKSFDKYLGMRDFILDFLRWAEEHPEAKNLKDRAESLI